MEVKIGVQYSPRELILETSSTAAEVDKQVSEALKSDSGYLRLSDDKGRTVLVPIDKLAYIEFTDAAERRVGFSS